ncbi:MAG: ATP/GTP-binding protein [Thermoplasmata archaeon]
MATPIVYVVGTAGSGKSTLVEAFRAWLVLQGYDAVTLNLDPGAETVPYEPDVDIRDWIRLSEIMEEYKLGPNGAQVVAADLIAAHVKEVGEVLEGYETDFLLADTPGQMELFTFRESSRVVIDAFGQAEGFLAYLSDPILVRSPSGLVSSLLLSATAQFRHSLPFLNVLSKADLLSEEDLQAVIKWSSDPYALYDALVAEGGSPKQVLDVEFLKALETIGVYRQLTPISSEIPYGLEDLYNGIQAVFAGGEDLEKR